MRLAPPRLDVAATLGDPWQIEGGAAEQRHRLGLTFAQVARRGLAVRLLALAGVPQEYVS